MAHHRASTGSTSKPQLLLPLAVSNALLVSARGLLGGAARLSLRAPVSRTCLRLKAGMLSE
ncbi:hypothetical protein GQ54DRAFT_314791 [Martensiomyces pterosporus]|nr:hypothetical protein GQ54DRAFT_314791 [Martensiomyces pterosporus]